MWCQIMCCSWRGNGRICVGQSSGRRRQPDHTRARSWRFPHRWLGHWSSHSRRHRAKFRSVQLAIYNSATEACVQSTCRSSTYLVMEMSWWIHCWAKPNHSQITFKILNTESTSLSQNPHAHLCKTTDPKGLDCTLQLKNNRKISPESNKLAYNM